MRHTTTRSRVARPVRALLAAVLVMAIGTAPAGVAEPTADQSAPDSVSAEQPALDAGADSAAGDASVGADADAADGVADAAGAADSVADSPADAYPAESSAAAQPSGTSTFGPDALVPGAITQDGITVKRDGDVDTIHVHDSEGELWQWGWKASEENIFALNRKGEVTEVLSVTADGRKLDRKKFGWVNTKDGAFIGFDLNALHTIPPVDVTIKVKTETKGDYDIAESEDIPTSQEFAKTGYDPKEELDPEVEAQLRAGDAESPKEHPGFIDYQIDVSEPKVEKGRNEEDKKISVTVQEPGEWLLSRFSFKDGCGVLIYPGFGGDVGIEVIRKDGEILSRIDEKMPFTTREDTRSKIDGREACHREWHRIRTAAEPNWVFDGATDVTLQNGDTIVFYVKGPKKQNNPEVKIWATPVVEEPDPSENPDVIAQDPNKTFTVTGEGVVMSPAQTVGDGSYTTDSKFRQETNFKGAVVRVSAPNSILAPEQYGISIDQIEDSTALGRKLIQVTDHYVEFEVFPVKNGSRIASAKVPRGATLTFKSSFGDNPERIDADVTVVGTPAGDAKESGMVTAPDGADWVEKRVPNPPMPKKCGLKVAIVADQSTSLKYADDEGRFDAFEESRKAAKAMVNALSGAPATQVGIYTFARTSPSSGTKGVGETQGPVDVNTSDGKINSRITDAIDEWKSGSAQGTTNWEAGLRKVQDEGYDVVYFITDGMPTWYDGSHENISEKNSGAFVQKTALNKAIIAANELKRQGTRIVPMMVDLQLQGTNVVTEDYVLKDLKAWPETGTPAKGKYFITNTGASPKPIRSLYKLKNGETEDTMVNVAEALKSGPNAFEVYEVDESGSRTTITGDQGKWTHGLRSVKTMGEDISGEGDTIRVYNYELLADRLEAIGKSISSSCGQIIIKKKIVNEQGEVAVNGASGWEFTASAPRSIFPSEKGALGQYSSTKTTSDDGPGGKGTTGWNVVSDKPVTINVEEKVRDGFTYESVVCKEEGSDDPLPTRKFGAAGFQVDVKPQDGTPVSVLCEVSNKGKEVPAYSLALKKVDASNKETQLDEAEFTLSWGDSEDERLTIAQGEDKRYSTEKILKPGKTYTLVETQSPLVSGGANGERYALLVAPVRFKIDVEEGKPVAKFAQGDQWVTDASTSGVWAETPDSADTSTVFLGVANVRQGNLPKTGGHGLQVPLALSTALMLFGAALARRRAVQV